MNLTERLAVAETRHAQIVSRLEAARIARDELRATAAKEREAYLAASAGAELDDGARPSRARLTELERELPDAEDRVAVLERAVAEAARQMRHARADVLTAQAEGVREETGRRQARINELLPQVEAMQAEITAHSRWISNEGPVLAARLDAEAVQLRRR